MTTAAANFLLFTDQYEPISGFTLEQKGKLLDACFLYHLGQPFDLSDDPAVQVAFAFFKSAFARRQELRESRQSAGSKGGQAKAENSNTDKQDQAKSGKSSKAKQNETSQAKADKSGNGYLQIQVFKQVQEKEIKESLSGESLESCKGEPPSRAVSTESSAAPDESLFNPPALEFQELRQFWDSTVRGEGCKCGYDEYRALKRDLDKTGHTAWPGLARIRDDVEKRIESGCWSDPAFYPGLKKYLSTCGWTAPISAKPATADKTKSWDEKESEQNVNAFLAGISKAS